MELQLDRLLGIKLTPDHPVTSLSSAREISDIISRMAQLDLQVISQRLLLYGMFYKVLYALQKGGDAYDASGRSIDYAEYAIGYMEQHYRDKIQVSNLAEKIGISRSYLTKVMQDRTGMSPKEYLTKIRMEKAAEYLVFCADSIKDIAVYCGYDDQMAFSRMFRQHHGCSPSEYRAQNRHNDQLSAQYNARSR